MRSGKFSDLTSMFDRVLVTPIAGSMHDDVGSRKRSWVESR